jgi:hypothetical protein
MSCVDTKTNQGISQSSTSRNLADLSRLTSRFDNLLGLSPDLAPLHDLFTQNVPGGNEMEVVLLDQAGGEGAFARALGGSVLRFGLRGS